MEETGKGADCWEGQRQRKPGIIFDTLTLRYLVHSRVEMEFRGEGMGRHINFGICNSFSFNRKIRKKVSKYFL